MIKKSLMLAAVLAASTAVSADCATSCNQFAGFNASFGASLNGDSANQVGTGANGVSFKNGVSKVGFGGVVAVGYNAMISAQQFLGATLEFGLDSMNLRADEGDNTPAVDKKLKTTLRKTWGTALVARLGHMLSDKTAVTFGLGFEMNRFKLRSENIALTQTVSAADKIVTANKTKFGISPRLGLEHKVSSNMFVRAEYSLLLCSAISATNNITDANTNGLYGYGSSVNSKVKPTQHKLTVSLGWRF